MDRNKVIDAMGYIGPEMIEEAAQAAPRSRRWRSSALIAACLCFALAGTVMAFEIVNVVDVFGFFVGERQEGSETKYGGYEYSGGGMEAVPVDAFSDELLADTAECVASTEGEPVDLFDDPTYLIHTYEREFNSWEEAEAYVGLDVLNNPLLDSAEPVRPQMDEGGYCNVSVSSRGNQGEPAYGIPADIYLYAAYSVPYTNSHGFTAGCRVDISALILTETYPHDREENPFESGYSSPVEGFEQETYVSPSGLEAAIVTTRSENYTDYTAYCVMDGVLLRISTLDKVGVLYEVLDNFQ